MWSKIMAQLEDKKIMDVQNTIMLLQSIVEMLNILLLYVGMNAQSLIVT